MKLRELYSKPIERTVNPAVSATKLDPETQRIEIEEYVFTDEILNGLYRILDAIKNNQGYEHVGIWIDGYYGSGKSHFLKYLDYCITPSTREEALARMLEAVRTIDPMDDKHNLDFGYDQMSSIAKWLKVATVDTCIFNLETSYDNATDKKRAFLHVFWNEFNGKRGFNKFNITLAQHLEKPLAEKGVFEAFKQRIAYEGGDWDNSGEAADLVDNELDMVLGMAKELAPSLSIDNIRERIIKRDTVVSIERFCSEVASYLKDKGDNYRLIFLADEVSQFINNERDRYLNLQEIVTKLSEACHNKVWVACTAQQDLTEILDNCQVVEEKDKEGKIKGRFEVKVSLKGTKSEVIVQKRILDKKEPMKATLANLYDKYKAAFDLQFKLPNSYASYTTEDDFVDYYPFVPYQFKLIMQVFNSFLNLGYVAREVKGNERSIIKVVHSTAKANADAELGKFISFDELYNTMFEEGLQHAGQKAVENAVSMARTYEPGKKEKTRLAVRVANVLFMVCNITQTDQLLFPATIDNITSLLVNSMDTPRLTLREEVEKIVDFLCENNVIRREQGRRGAPDTLFFYSEEEMNVAQLIRSQKVDNNTQADQLRGLFCKYIPALRNKEPYKTRNFSVGLTIKQRNFLNTNNPDVVVELMVDNDYDTAEDLALQHGSPHRMIYYAGPQYQANQRLRHAFLWYCQVALYMATPTPSDSNANTRKEFARRAEELYESIIKKEMEKILDTCPIISGMQVIDEAEIGQKRGNERYRAAIVKHLSGIYPKAGLVDQPGLPTTTEQLHKAILRNVNPGEYEGMDATLTSAEHEVEVYLNKQYDEVNVADVLAKFAKAPYGWANICTLYVINELVRRHRRDYTYANNPHVETSTVASHIVSEASKFTLRPAKAIPKIVIQDFIAAWRDIFGMANTPASTDSTQLFRSCRDIEAPHSLAKIVRGYKDIEQQIIAYPFCKPLREAIDLFEAWTNERDPLAFFTRITEDKEQGKALFDQCKEVVQFTHDHLTTYKQLLQFIDDNQYNFPFVPTDNMDAVDRLLKLKNDPWPINGLRGYIRWKDLLSRSLENVRTGLREKIRRAYNDLFDYLLQVAEKQGVPPSVLSQRDATLLAKTSPDNIPVLQNNLNTDTFYKEQIEKIMTYASPRPSEGGQPTRPAKRIRQASLQTKTKLPITNADDIDRYLAGLRDQLLRLLVGHDGVMIIK